MSKKRTIIITGAAGLLGRNLITALAEKYAIHAIVRTKPVTEISEIEYHIIDFTKSWSTTDLPKKADSIIHLAQSSHFRKFPQMALDIFKVNVDSTAILLDHAMQTGVKKFIYASSGGIDNSSSKIPYEKSSINIPGQLGYYLGSKLCSEILTNSYNSLIQVSILRFFFMYGKGQNRSMLIPRLVDRIKAGQPISIQGKNGIHINPIHVIDACKAVMAVLKTNENATFNIGGPEVLSLRQICHTIAKEINTKPIFSIQMGKNQDLIADISMMKKKLIRPKIYLSEGIQDLL